VIKNVSCFTDLYLASHRSPIRIADTALNLVSALSRFWIEISRVGRTRAKAGGSQMTTSGAPASHRSRAGYQVITAVAYVCFRREIGAIQLAETMARSLQFGLGKNNQRTNPGDTT